MHANISEFTKILNKFYYSCNMVFCLSKKRVNYFVDYNLVGVFFYIDIEIVSLVVFLDILSDYIIPNLSSPGDE